VSSNTPVCLLTVRLKLANNLAMASTFGFADRGINAKKELQVSFLDHGYELIKLFLSSEQLEVFDSELGAVELPLSAGGIRNAQSKYASVHSLGRYTRV